MEDTFNVDIIQLIKKNLILFIAAALVFGAAAYGLSFLLPNEYAASTTMYLLRQNNQEEAVTAETGELQYASYISTDLLAIMNSARAKKNAAELLGEGGLGGCTITTDNSSVSRMVTLTVKGKDPQKCADVANAMVQATRELAVEIMNIKAINVIDEAVPSSAPIGPNHRQIGLYGAALGLALSFAYAFIRAAADTRIRSGDEASKIAGVPVIGHFAYVD